VNQEKDLWADTARFWMEVSAVQFWFPDPDPDYDMSIAAESLLDSKQRVVRVVGRELLAKVREKSESLGVEDDPDAVHDFRVALRRLRSWLRAFDDEMAATVSPKVQRRFKRIADATRTSRDCEVHIEWLEKFGKSRRGKYQKATAWLVDDLRSQKANADLKLREAVDKDLERTSAQLAKGLSHYIVNLDAPADSMAFELARLIRDHAESAASCIARIESVGDRAQAHEARIAVKRLRYIVEPLGETIADAIALVDDLSKLQDELGALHDAQIFGSEIAKHLAKVLAASTPIVRGDEPSDDEGEASASDRADALRAISQRLHREELRAFKMLGETWLSGGTDDLWVRANRIATALESTRAA
jgi:CHAD domain-containing protein